MGILRSSLPASHAQVTPKIAHLSDTPVPIRKYARHVTDKGRRELSLPTLLTTPPEGRRSPYEAHHSVVDHHGPNPVGGKRGGSGGGDRLRRSAKLGRWAGRVHPEGRKRCRSWRHYRGQGSSQRGRDNSQERDKAARRRRRDRSARQSQGRLALLEGFWTDGYLRPRRRESQNGEARRAARERCERFWLHDPGLQDWRDGGQRRVRDRRYRRSQRYCCE